MMRALSILMFLVLVSTAAKGGETLFSLMDGDAPAADCRIWGEVEPVPAGKRAEQGELLIKKGGFTRELPWAGEKDGWLTVGARFRNVPEGGAPGLEITLYDAQGFAGQIRGKLTREGGDVLCHAAFPVTAELTRISIWSHGVKDAPVGIDRYTIQLEPVPAIAELPPTPKLGSADAESVPGKVKLRFGNHLGNSRGAVVERAGDGGEFHEIGRAAPGAHTFTDPAAKPAGRYRYRVKNCSDGGESAWSAPFAVTVPDWFYSPGNKTYHVDAENGDDSKDGTSPEHAWKSAGRVSRTIFAPGDRIRFRRGCCWTEPVELRGSGTPESPVRLDAYGEGPLPRIDVADTPFALRLKNQSNWAIGELELSNRQTLPGGLQEIRKGTATIRSDSPFFAPYARKRAQSGAVVELDNYGVAANIRLHDLHIHDVEGRQDTKENGGILVRIDGSRKPSRFDNLIIENNQLQRVCRSGIVFQVWPHARRGTYWFPSTGVRISGNRLSDIGGDGIVPWVCDGARITNNEVCRAACTALLESNVAIWPWSSDNTVVSGNIAAFTAKYPGNGDGQGYDADTNCNNTLVENNLSFQNGGGFILICGEKETPNRGITVRNNVSIADGMSCFTLWNNLADVKIYRNTVLANDNCKMVYLIANWGKGDADPIQMENVEFYDNLIVADTPLALRGVQKSWRLRDNQYWGAFGREAAEKFGSGNTVADPDFSGAIDCNGDIPSQQEKLIPRKTPKGARLRPPVGI